MERPLHAADISAAFPTLLKPAAKHRRRSVSEVGPTWAARAARAEIVEAAAADAEAQGAPEPEASGQGVYWSDPLPLPGQGGGGAAAAAACARAAPFAPAADPADDDMQDTAASPASSCGGAPSSPADGGMDTCCCAASPAPTFSPLREFLLSTAGLLMPATSCRSEALRPNPSSTAVASALHYPKLPALLLCRHAAGALRHALPAVEQPDCGFPAISVQVRAGAAQPCCHCCQSTAARTQLGLPPAMCLASKMLPPAGTLPL